MFADAAAPGKSSPGVNVMVPSRFSTTEPLATLTAGPPAVIAVPLMAVTTRPLFSKVSLPSTLMITPVSSAVLAVSATMSTMALTVMPTEPVAVENAVVPPLVLASAVPPFVPLVWSQARMVSVAVPL
ncbi:hypothetical protein LMG5911_03295 [Achromobacter spanius]|nr:hypothetical protein LMG5911_03295 [Achromobacter spanius]